MKKLALLVMVSSVLSSFSFAQDFSFSSGQQDYTHERGSVLLIPWEGKMYLSDINREVHYRTGLEIDEIKRLFREGFCQVFAQEASEKWDVVDLVTEDNEGHLSDLEYAHASVAYSYSKVPPPPKEKPDSKAKALLNRFTQKEDPEQSGRGVSVNEGQIHTYYDEKERYMSTRVDNPELLPYLSEKYEYDYVVFLNELDIKVMRDHNVEHGQVWERRIKVHYSVFDAGGVEITSGAAYAEYDGYEKDIFSIIRNNFDFPSQNILSQMDVAIQALQTAESKANDDDDY
ncbi:MAG: hypothetical protein HKN32_03940 [Flavobacteriales bacterium]|nr:hypothetical protein [Flavobacteriales bacterium]